MVNQIPWGYSPIGFDLSQMLGNMSNQFSNSLNQSSESTARALQQASDAWVRILNQAAHDYFDDPVTAMNGNPAGGGTGGFDSGEIARFIDDVSTRVTDATEQAAESAGQIESAFTPSDESGWDIAAKNADPISFGDNPFTNADAAGWGKWLIAVGIVVVYISTIEKVDKRAALVMGGIIVLGVAMTRKTSAGKSAITETGDLVSALLNGEFTKVQSNGTNLVNPFGGSQPRNTPMLPNPTVNPGVIFDPSANAHIDPNPVYAGHNAVDIFANAGSVFRAPVSGTLEYLDLRNSAGGNAFMLHGDDGYTYYGAHMQSPMQSGHVQQGQQIGFVGTTGNAAGKPAHVHLAIGRGANGIDNNGSGNVNPVSIVRGWLGLR